MGAAIAMLAGCGGGGGGSSAPPTTPASEFLVEGINLTLGNLVATQTFNAFSIIAKRETNGAIDFRFSEDDQTKITLRPRAGAPNNDFQIRLQISQTSNDASIDLTFDTRQTNPDLFVRVPFGSVDVLSFNERTIGPTTRFVIANPNGAQQSFSYQTFGFWENVSANAPNRIGGFSIGVVTPSAVLQSAPIAIGQATYRGSLLGEVKTTGLSNETGSPITALVTAEVNFVTRSATLTTTNSQVRGPNGAFAPENAWNVSGTLAVSLTTNRLEGNVSGPGGLNGEVRARFYGLEAQELGGVLHARDATRELSAGFGAKR